MTLLFELQYWHGAKFTQRFHAYDNDGHVVWDRAWPLFELQNALRRYTAARREVARAR